jgi:hypothetical protein
LGCSADFAVGFPAAIAAPQLPAAAAFNFSVNISAIVAATLATASTNRFVSGESAFIAFNLVA